MKILGIGNAIVDVICKIDDKFITQNKLTKSTMKLVDEVEFKKLLATLKIEDTTEGNVSFERIILLFFFTPKEYSNAVQAVVPLEKDKAYFDPK